MPPDEKAIAEERLARKGIRTILTRSLALSRRDEVILITDETRIREIVLFSSVSANLGIAVVPVVVPTKAQRLIRDPASLPSSLRAAVDHCQGLIVLMDYSAQTTPFRMSALQYFKDVRKGARAASMPGVRLPQLKYTAADYREIDNLTSQLANLLIRTKLITIETDDGSGNRLELNVPVEGMYPTMCGSRIEIGDWDNVPTGETFILPRGRSSEGHVAITGSIPGLVLPPKSPVILKISRGRIVDLRSSLPRVKEKAWGLFFRNTTQKLLGRNANVLCEVGFGVNRSVNRLHGTPVFDEKIYGSVHLAFGRNDQLGGKIKGSSHHDLVTLKPRVTFDCLRKAVILNGRINVSDDDVEISWQDVRAKVNASWLVERAGLHCSYDPKTRALIMEWMQCAGPKAATRIGDLETSILAGDAYNVLKKPMTVGEFVSEMEEQKIQANAALGALAVLYLYRIIRLRRRRPGDG